MRHGRGSASTGGGYRDHDPTGDDGHRHEVIARGRRRTGSTTPATLASCQVKVSGGAFSVFRSSGSRLENAILGKEEQEEAVAGSMSETGVALPD